MLYVSWEPLTQQDLGEFVLTLFQFPPLGAHEKGWGQGKRRQRDSLGSVGLEWG